MENINAEMLTEFRNEAKNDMPFKKAALARNDIKDLICIPDRENLLNGAFTIEIDTHGITAQRDSGRCWLFAALNLYREEIRQKLNMEQFEFSENYLSFYDKLEKANNYLESIIRYGNEPLTSRHNAYILAGIGDGNVWGHAAYLLKKYGAVPKEVMPETYQSEHTAEFLKYVNRLLHKDAAILRQIIKEGNDPSPAKQKMLAEIWHMEVLCFGLPPASFDYCWRDKEHQYHEMHTTPQAFFQDYTETDPDAYIHVINEPQLKMYCSNRYHSRGNAVDEDRIRLNLPMDDLEELILKQLKDGRPVWFGCESGAWMDRKKGIFDPDSFAADDLFDVDFAMNKKDLLVYHEAYASHNMLLTGVHLNREGKPDRWKIENSWGEEAGQKGIFVCSEKYFRNYVFEAAIYKKYFNEKQLEAMKKEPQMLETWEAE